MSSKLEIFVVVTPTMPLIILSFFNNGFPVKVVIASRGAINLRIVVCTLGSIRPPICHSLKEKTRKLSPNVQKIA